MVLPHLDCLHRNIASTSLMRGLYKPTAKRYGPLGLLFKIRELYSNLLLWLLKLEAQMRTQTLRSYGGSAFEEYILGFLSHHNSMKTELLSRYINSFSKLLIPEFYLYLPYLPRLWISITHISSTVKHTPWEFGSSPEAASILFWNTYYPTKATSHTSGLEHYSHRCRLLSTYINWCSTANSKPYSGQGRKESCPGDVNQGF